MAKEKPDNKLSGQAVIPERVEIKRGAGGEYVATLRAKKGQQRLRFVGRGATPLEAIEDVHDQAGVSS
jgi:hypothetical protein